jgi:hypothetical protein
MGSLVSTSAAKAATAAGLSSIHDLKVISPGDAAYSQAGLHIGKVETVTKKDTTAKVAEVGKKRGI